MHKKVSKILIYPLYEELPENLEKLNAQNVFKRILQGLPV